MGSNPVGSAKTNKINNEVTMNIFENKSFDNHEQVVFCQDKNTGLKAIIGIHNTKLGPALGGTRFYPYSKEEDALTDVLRLSKGMTYKAAISGLDLGGGKAVIIGDPQKIGSEAFFRAFGRFVNSLNGRYITAEDVGTTVRDMDWIRRETSHVTGVSSHIGGSGDPSPFTAHGIFVGIKAGLKKQKGNDSVSGVKVAVQGVGHVGYYLCKELHEQGAKLYVSDINEEAIKRVVNEFKAEVIKGDSIYSADVDVYAPCALGATINDNTIPMFKCSVISGAANNQLLETKHGDMLQKAGILYAPDYVVNAGGLLNVNAEIHGGGTKLVLAQIENIYHTLLHIFDIANKESVSTAVAANHFAEKRIAEVKIIKDIFNGGKKK
jgi:leucine dehydrogenase